MLWTYSMRKGFISVSLLQFAKKLGRSSYDVTMTHYEVMPILFLFIFVANVQDIQWEDFLVLTINRRGVIRIYLPQAKRTPSHAYKDLK